MKIPYILYLYLDEKNRDNSSSITKQNKIRMISKKSSKIDVQKI